MNLEVVVFLENSTLKKKGCLTRQYALIPQTLSKKIQKCYTREIKIDKTFTKKIQIWLLSQNWFIKMAVAIDTLKHALFMSYTLFALYAHP